jgi:hypothetical protein
MCTHADSGAFLKIALKVITSRTCYDTTLIFLEYEIGAMGRRSMNVDVAVMR